MNTRNINISNIFKAAPTTIKEINKIPERPYVHPALTGCDEFVIHFNQMGVRIPGLPASSIFMDLFYDYCLLRLDEYMTLDDLSPNEPATFDYNEAAKGFSEMIMEFA